MAVNMIIEFDILDFRFRFIYIGVWIEAIVSGFGNRCFLKVNSVRLRC